MIHSTAVIDPAAKIADDVEIGAYCVIGANVTIGSGTVLKSHVVINGYTTIGENNLFYPFAAIGQLTQDLKYVSEPTSLVIGDRNTFRENCTVHRSTGDGLPTTIGDDNLFLCYSHIAHDCQLGNHIILSNNGTLAGHCIVGDHVIISGLSAVHQFCRIGKHSIVGGLTKVIQDVSPFTIVDGADATVRGINLIGLQRRGFDEASCRALKNTYKKLFLNKKNNLTEVTNELAESELGKDENVAHLIEFIRTSERGITR